MDRVLRVLHLEDDPGDAELVRDVLEAGGIVCDITRVQTREGFVASLEQGRFDLILADYSLPSFDGMSALKITAQRSPDVPYIFVSGMLGEEIAIGALKMGATDYVLKERLSGLVPSVQRALREANERSERRRAEEALRASEERFRTLVESSFDVYWESDENHRFIRQEFAEGPFDPPARDSEIGKTFWEIGYLETDEEVWRKHRATLDAHLPFRDFELTRPASDGGKRYFSVSGLPAFDATGRFVGYRGVGRQITERRRAEEAERAANARLEGILNIARDAIISADSRQRIILFNQGAEKVFGYAQAEVIGCPVDLLVPQRFRGGHWKHIEDFARSPDNARMIGQRSEVSGLRKDGTEFPADASISKLELGGELIFTIILRDITERKRAEEALRRSRTYLAEAQRLSHTGSWAWSPDQDIKYWSEECYRVLSFDPRDGLPQFEDFLQRIHPDDQPGFRELIQTAIREKAEWEADYRIVHPDGPVRDIHVLGHPVLGTSGDLVEFVGTVIDVTDRKRAEEELRRSQHYLAEGQRLSHTGSWAWNPISNTILYWSEESYRIYGYHPAQGLPSFESAVERIHPEDRPAVLMTVDKAVREKADFQTEHRLVLPGGIVRNLRLLAHPVLNASGELIEYLGTVIDVTEQKRAEEERKEHLWFLECMDRINRAMQGTNDPEQMMSEVLDAVLEIFACDRAWLVYPCDPDAPSCRAVMEHTRPEFPGAFTLDEEFPVDAQAAELLRRALDGPGAATDLSVPAEVRERFSIQSIIAIAVRPKGDRPYLFGLHQCSHARAWTAAERRLFEEIARRLEDALTSVLAHRNLLASQEELRRSQHYLAEAQKVSHTGSWAWSPVSNTIVYWSEECYRILGYDLAQGLPSFESSFERIHPEDRPALVEAIERAVREKAEFQIEYRLVLPDGTRRNVGLQSHPVLDASGELVQFIGTVMDVTEQKRAEEERKEHLQFLESMDRINRAMQRSNDVELMTSGVIQEALEIFACDRACLTYPCDPETPAYRTVMEHTSPEYGGVLTLGQDRPVTPEWAEVLRRALQHPEAVVDPSLPPGRRERFRIASLLAIAVRPKGDRPYLLTVHSERSRSWTAAELRLFEEIARRLGDALTSVLAHRNLLAREEELRRSQHYLAEGQKLSHTGSWAWNPLSNTILYWSEECYRIYGYDPAQGVPSFESVVERIHPEDRPAVLETVDKVVREKAAFQLEYRLILPGGSVRNHRVLAHPVLNASGELIEYLGTVIDVTEQKRAEEERKEHLWFLECMDRINRAMQRTNHVEGMMSGVLEETLAIFGSDRARLAYPCDPDAATSRVVMQHTRPEYPGAFALGEEFPMHTHTAELMRRVLEGPGAVVDLSVPPQIHERFSIQSIIAIAVRPKGDRPYLFATTQCSHARAWTAAERRLFEEIARRLEDALTSVLAHRNLLAREEELRRSRAYLAEAQKVSHTGSWAWNNVTRENVYWSEECFRIYGRDPAQGLPSLEQILADIHPEDAPGTVASLEKALDEGREWEGEYRLIHFADGPRTIRTIAHPVPDRAGRVVEYIGTVVDITEQKRAEQELRTSELERARAEQALRRSQKMEAIGTLAGGVAHDFNNILGAILGYSELAQGKLREGKALGDELEQVMQAGNRGKRLVEHILAFSRSGVGSRVPVHVESVVAEALALLAASLPPGVRLEQKLSAGDAAVVGDATQLHQVAMNLCTNAVQAMARGGVLTVTLDRVEVMEQRPLSHGVLEPGDYLRLAVSDTGSGIPQAALERIFDPFFTTKGVGKGTGLGLSLVHGIVADSRGVIDVATREGAGTTFTVWLPCSGETAVPPAEDITELPHGNGESVMIVDDEQPLLRLAEETLAQLGYDPAGFDSSVAALEAFRAEPQRYDMILTDQTMPDLTGTDLAREVRQLRPELPVVLMSGYKGPQLTALAQAAGVRDILHKPLVSRDIAEAISRALPGAP